MVATLWRYCGFDAWAQKTVTVVGNLVDHGIVRPTWTMLTSVERKCARACSRLIQVIFNSNEIEPNIE